MGTAVALSVQPAGGERACITGGLQGQCMQAHATHRYQ